MTTNHGASTQRPTSPTRQRQLVQSLSPARRLTELSNELTALALHIKERREPTTVAHIEGARLLLSSILRFVEHHAQQHELDWFHLQTQLYEVRSSMEQDTHGWTKVLEDRNDPIFDLLTIAIVQVTSIEAQAAIFRPHRPTQAAVASRPASPR